jgi:Outer membrane protein beta-barrel domain
MVCMVLFAANSAMAQLSLGPRAALISSSVSLEDDIAAIKEGDAQIGYQLGIFARINLAGLFVQPELLFTSSESALDVTGVGDVSLNFNKIDVPVMVGMKLGPLRLQVGPSFSFLTSAESETPAGIVEDVTENYKNSTVGYQVGVGIDISKLVLDLKYEGSLSAYADALPGWVETDQRVSQWVLAVGFKLF